MWYLKRGTMEFGKGDIRKAGDPLPEAFGWPTARLWLLSSPVNQVPLIEYRHPELGVFPFTGDAVVHQFPSAQITAPAPEAKKRRTG